MLLRARHIFMMMSIVFVLGGAIVWQRSVIDAGITGRFDDARTVAELRDRIAGLEREVAAGAEAQRATGADEQRLLTQARAERDALAQRLDSLSRQFSDVQAERKRVADALVASERQLEDQRGAAARAEQDVTLLRAELLWQKVRVSATVTTAPDQTASQPGRPPAGDVAAPRDVDAVALPRRAVRQEKQRPRRPPADEPKISSNPFSFLP